MATTPNSFTSPQTPISLTAVATTAEVAFSAPTNAVTLVDDATNTNGIVLFSLYAINRAANSGVNNCTIYEKVGSVYTLIDSQSLAVNTPSATVVSAKAVFNVTVDTPLYVGAGKGIAVAIGAAVANGIAFHAVGGAY